MTGHRFCWGAAVVIGVLSGAFAAGSDGYFPATTTDGRFGSRCGMPIGGSDKTYCIAPFARLIAQPERYHGKRIMVFGYLANDGDFSCLYPSRDSFLEHAPDECVYVPSSAIPHDIAPMLGRGVWARIAGKFDATFQGPVEYLGRLDEIQLIGRTRFEDKPS